MNSASAPHAHSHSTASDKLGQALSVICMIHCVATPVVVGLLPTLAAPLAHTHPIILVFVLITALWAFVPGYLHHRSIAVLALALVGIACLATAVLAFDADAAIHIGLTVVGATLMLAAHLVNQRQLKACRHGEAH